MYIGIPTRWVIFWIINDHDLLLTLTNCTKILTRIHASWSNWLSFSDRNKKLPLMLVSFRLQKAFKLLLKRYKKLQLFSLSIHPSVFLSNSGVGVVVLRNRHWVLCLPSYKWPSQDVCWQTSPGSGCTAQSARGAARPVQPATGSHAAMFVVTPPIAPSLTSLCTASTRSIFRLLYISARTARLSRSWAYVTDNNKNITLAITAANSIYLSMLKASVFCSLSVQLCSGPTILFQFYINMQNMY